MGKYWSVLLVALAFLVPVLGSDVLGEEARTIIRVRGADSLARRMDLLSQEYMKTNPAVYVVVSGGSKEMTGIRELAEGHSEVAMASCKASPEDLEIANKKGIALVEKLVGYGGIVILTHPENPVGELTVDQVKGILSGAITDWAAVGGPPGPIKVVTVGDAHGGTLAFLERTFLGGGSITKSAIRVERFPAAIRTVANTPGSVGYSRVRDALESPDTKNVQVKIVSIKKDANSPAVFPSRQNIDNDTYAIKRPFYLYHDKQAQDHVKKFVDFIVGKGWGPQSL